MKSLIFKKSKNLNTKLTRIIFGEQSQLFTTSKGQEGGETSQFLFSLRKVKTF